MHSLWWLVVSLPSPFQHLGHHPSHYLAAHWKDAAPADSTGPSKPSVEEVAAAADSNKQQAEASIAQVEADVKRMSIFGAELKQELDQQEKVKQGIQHALGYFHEQEDLAQEERDGCATKVQNLEAEVASLKRTIKTLEEVKAMLRGDKATLEEANKKMISQVNSIFQYGQAVQTGLAFKGLAASAEADTRTAKAANATAAAA